MQTNVKKQSFLKKHRLSENDYRQILKFERTRLSGKMNMHEYLTIMYEFSANGGKRIADFVQNEENYNEFLEVHYGQSPQFRKSNKR